MTREIRESGGKRLKANRVAADTQTQSPQPNVRVWADRAEDLVPFGSSRNVGDPVPVDPSRSRKLLEFIEKRRHNKPEEE